MVPPLNLARSRRAGEAFQSPRPRGASAMLLLKSPFRYKMLAPQPWTVLWSSHSIVVLLMLFQPEHDVSS
jgi:hypothetical protein